MNDRMVRKFNLFIILHIFMILLYNIFNLPEAGAADFRPGEILVQLKPHARSSAPAEKRRMGMQIRQSLSNGRLLHLTLPEGMSVTQAAEALAREPDVAFVEPNYIITTQATPNDPYFDLQWGLYNSGQVVNGYVGVPGTDIDALEAWALQVSSDKEHIIVAVVDTGCALDHPDLHDRLWTNPDEIPDNLIDDDGNGFVDDVHGWDMVDNDNDPSDAVGHGTHVAGIIAAQSNNGIGISGVNDQADIMAVRFIDGFQTGSIADAVKAIDYALANGARIINCSWGGSGESAILYNTMAQANALFVCAAGNYGADADEEGFFPAGYNLTNIISVAAVDQMNRLSGFSNYGRKAVDVAAPGVRIYSLYAGREIIRQETFDADTFAQWTEGGPSGQWALRPAASGATVQGLTFSDGNTYEADIDTWIQSPAISLEGLTACMLDFNLIGSTQAGRDLLFLEISTDGVQWQNLPLMKSDTVFSCGISGTVPYWSLVFADLGAWDGAADVFFRFRFSSDATVNNTGYYISRLNLSASGATETYGYLNGTSMATAFVSGLAAILQSEDSSLTMVDIRQTIEKSVEPNMNLSGLVASGGRINAYNALTLDRDLSLNAELEPSGQVRLSWRNLNPTAVGTSDRITIERRTGDEDAFAPLDTIPLSQEEFIDSDVDPYVTYCYRLAVENPVDLQRYSNQALALSPQDPETDANNGGGSGGCFINGLSNRRIAGTTKQPAQ